MPVYRPLDEQALDQWVSVLLRERHPGVVNEPLPNALYKLLQDDRLPGPG